MDSAQVLFDRLAPTVSKQEWPMRPCCFGMTQSGTVYLTPLPIGYDGDVYEHSGRVYARFMDQAEMVAFGVVSEGVTVEAGDNGRLDYDHAKRARTMTVWDGQTVHARYVVQGDPEWQGDLFGITEEEIPVVGAADLIRITTAYFNRNEEPPDVQC